MTLRSVDIQRLLDNNMQTITSHKHGLFSCKKGCVVVSSYAKNWNKTLPYCQKYARKLQMDDIEKRTSFDSQNMGLPLYNSDEVDHQKCRYPFCIVWTPIPCLTWLLPFIGHMGICTSSGVIRDFAGPYYVSEDCMAFGNPTKYWRLKADGIGKELWDRSVHEASEIYKGRMHNLCCDNCHSHVARALNIMRFQNSGSWNMVKLCALMLWHGKYVSAFGFLKTWLPFLILAAVLVCIIVPLQVQ